MLIKKSLLFIISCISFCQITMAQSTVTGKVVDAVTKESLVGISITLINAKKGTVTATDGSFTIRLSGMDELEITSVGYLTKKMEVTGGQHIGEILLQPSTSNMKEIVVSSNISIDRKTPYAVSTLRAAAIEERISNKEFPELLKTTPSTYVTKAGGGFGDSRISVRGFSQNNTAVMINGVPVNDMENGAVFWSNWAGLSDIASNIQVQRGLGASKLSIAAVGGNINIVTKATEIQKGGQASVTYGNDGYVKTTLGYNTGKSKKGLALSLLASETQGNGYVDGTKFKGWNYFATLGWEINNKHTFTITATGAPQWHHQRSAAIAYQTFFGNPNDPTVINRGIKYNDSWGNYHNEEFSWSKNFYHKPVANLNYYWDVNSKTKFSAVIYASLGRGGGTGPIGSINGKSGFSLPKNAQGTIRFDDIEKWNTGVGVPEFGSNYLNNPWTMDGPYKGQYIATNSTGLIRRASMNSHNWYGAIFNITHDLSSTITLNGGLDLRKYKGLHYRRIEDGLGTVAYYETKDLNNPGEYVSTDDNTTAIDYHNDGLVRQSGGYFSAEYDKNKLSVFVAGSLSNTNYQRVDYFLYDFKTDSRWQSAKRNFRGFVAKGGFNYRITEKHNVFVNAGYFEKAPLFNAVWPNNNNTDFGRNLTAEKILSTELGYGFRSKAISININAYSTQWKDKNIIRSFPDPATGLTFRANIAGLIALHQGIEFEATSRAIDKLDLQAMFSVGNWRYKNDVTTDIYNDANEKIGTVNLYTAGLKVGDAAQTTANFSAGYEFLKGFRIRGSYYYADNLFANFTPETRTNIANVGVQAWKLPAYGLMDGMLSYSFKLNGQRITFRGNVDNVFDKRYIAESTDDIKYNPADPTDFVIGDNGSGKRDRVNPGFGRTWTVGVKVNFK